MTIYRPSLEGRQAKRKKRWGKGIKGTIKKNTEKREGCINSRCLPEAMNLNDGDWKGRARMRNQELCSGLTASAEIKRQKRHEKKKSR